MFLNRITKPAVLLAELEKRRGLRKVQEFTAIPEDRLDALKAGDGLLPEEEWALIGFCDAENLYELLEEAGAVPPVYNRHSDFDFSLKPLGMNGPPRDYELKTRPTKVAGHVVDYPVGIPACALTPNHHWLRFYADRGFCILTHKTVRSDFWQGHPKPHWAFAEPNGRFEPPEFPARVTASMKAWPKHPADFNMVNSFGVPSQQRDLWQEEVKRARAALGPGTLLIVSVMGTPERADSEDDLVNDFADVALMAKEAGAQVIEANYSCPNTKGGHDDVYSSPDLSARISREIRGRIGSDFPFLIKIGYLRPSLLREVILENANWVNGVVAINTIRVPVVNDDGDYFFAGRPNAGLSGSWIKPFAKQVVTQLVTLNEREHLNLDILAVGGVTTADDVEEFLDLGATAVLTCTGAYMNPYLAMEARLAQKVDREGLKAAFGEDAVTDADGVAVRPTV